MRPWNPYSLDRVGTPIIGQVPVRVTVYGPPMTPAQSAMLQGAFANFQGVARQSVVNNPSASGALPDGSRYTIDCVNGVCNCAVWTASTEDEYLRRSGIVISLRALDGALIPEHSEDGFAIQYLFTPITRKGSRISTGRWKVRKLKPPTGGGKASNADEKGTTYIVGAQGKRDIDFPVNAGAVGNPNSRAYMVSANTGGAVYSAGKIVGEATEESPIPFVLTHEGRKHSAQLLFTPKTASEPGFVDLYIGEIGETPADLVDTVTLDASQSIDWRRVSFSPDGRLARCIVLGGGNMSRGVFSITPTSLSLSTFGAVNAGTTTYMEYETPQYDSGSEYTGPMTTHYTLTEWQYLNFNSMKTVGGVPVSRPMFGEDGTGTAATTSAPDLIFAYGPRGQSVDRVTNRGYSEMVTTQRSTYDMVSNWTADSGIPGYGSTTLASRSDTYEHSIVRRKSQDTEFSDFVGNSESDVVERTTSSYSTTSSVRYYDYAPTVNISKSGGGSGKSSYRLSGGVVPIFFDRDMGFGIYTEHTGETVHSAWEFIPNFGALPTKEYLPEPPRTPASSSLVVQDRNGILMSVALPAVIDYRFVAYSASDPMTGALLVNLLKVKALGGEKLDSWLFLVDDKGAKHLSSVLAGVPSNARAESNALIYSL